MLVGCQGSHGHIRIPLDVSITGDRSSCFVADFFKIVFLKIIFYRFQFQVDLYLSLFSNVYFFIRKMWFLNKYTNTLTSCSWIRFWFDQHVSFFFNLSV